MTQIFHDAAHQARALLDGGHRLDGEAHDHGAVVAAVAGDAGRQAVLAIQKTKIMASGPIIS